MSGFKHELGATVKDKVTGYGGIIIGRTEWLYGCRRYTVQSQEMKDGKPVDALAFDEDALEVLIDVKPHNVKSTGGPGRDATASRKDPSR